MEMSSDMFISAGIIFLGSLASHNEHQLNPPASPVRIMKKTHVNEPTLIANNLASIIAALSKFNNEC